MGTLAAPQIKSYDHYFWHKLFSLCGVFPVGAFLAEHFWANSYALVSINKYDETSRGLQQIPWRLAVEIVFIWVPILFHGIYGMYIWWNGKSNVLQFPWLSNWVWALQRWTGMIAFAFIGWHVWTERLLTEGKSDFGGVRQSLENPYCLGFYLVGVVASSFHFGSGIWNFLCKWGFAASARSQRAAAWGGVAVGFVFGLVGVLIVLSIHFDWRPFESYVR
jgi:succinate dehydrogenase / fumarate reductase cytochrome b subunit